jgi:hypothetical protein
MSAYSYGPGVTAHLVLWGQDLALSYSTTRGLGFGEAELDILSARYEYIVSDLSERWALSLNLEFDSQNNPERVDRIVVVEEVRYKALNVNGNLSLRGKARKYMFVGGLRLGLGVGLVRLSMTNTETFADGAVIESKLFTHQRYPWPYVVYGAVLHAPGETFSGGMDVVGIVSAFVPLETNVGDAHRISNLVMEGYARLYFRWAPLAYLAFELEAGLQWYGARYTHDDDKRRIDVIDRRGAGLAKVLFTY